MPYQFLMASTAMPHSTHQLYFHTNHVQQHFCFFLFILVFLSYGFIWSPIYSVHVKKLQSWQHRSIYLHTTFLVMQELSCCIHFDPNRFIDVSHVLILNRMDIHGG